MRCDEIGHHARAEGDESGIGRRGRYASSRPWRQHAFVGKLQRRPDRLIGRFGGLSSDRRNLDAERDTFRNTGFDFAMENRRQRRALRDQFGLGLLDQLVLVDF